MFVECVRMYSLPSSQRALYTPWLNDGRTEVEKNKNDIVSLSLFPHRMFLSFLLCGATRDFMVVMSPRAHHAVAGRLSSACTSNVDLAAQNAWEYFHFALNVFFFLVEITAPLHI